MLLWWLAYKSRIAAWNQVCHHHTERRTWVSTSSITEPYSSQTMLNASHIPVRRLIIVTGGTTVTSQLPGAKSHPHHVPQVLQLQANSPSCGSSCEPTGRHSMSCCCVRSDTGTQQLYNSVRRDCGRLALATKLVVQQHPSC